MINPETVQREKILFAYTSALEQGDFARVESILERARGDAILERQIVEINAALSQPQEAAAAQAGVKPPLMRLWQRIKTSAARLLPPPARFWPMARTVGVVVIVGVVILVGGLALLGPAIRGTFQNIVSPLLPSSVSSREYLQPAYPAQTESTKLPRNLVVAPTAAPPTPQVQATQAVAATEMAQSQGSTSSAYPASGSPQVTTDRLIVRNGNLIEEAKDTRQARQAVMALVDEFSAEGAFVVSANETYPYGDQMPVINLVIRVPVKHYDESMNRLAGLGIKVLNRYETSQDVTQNYVDVSARIEALQTSRERLLEIIKNAQNTEDLLRAEQELSRREAELEAAKANQQYLAQTAALSSISLELRPAVTSQPVTDKGWDPAATFHNAVSALLATLRGLADGIIFFAIATLPWLVVIGLLIFGVVRLLQRRVKK